MCFSTSTFRPPRTSDESVDIEPPFQQLARRPFIAEEADKSVMAFSAPRPGNAGNPLGHFENLFPHHATLCAA
jgi:hypothetical protein